MTPLEIATDAYNKSRWNGSGPRSRQNKSLEAMRAALLALANALEDEPSSDACIVKLRSIATETDRGNEDG